MFLLWCQTLKRHSHVIAISACGDDDEMVVSFKRSSLSYETAKMASVLSASSQQFFEKLILVLLIIFDQYPELQCLLKVKEDFR